MRIETDYSPGRLTIVWSLTTHLELEPLVEMVSFLERLVREILISIVLFDNVLDDSPRLP